MGRNQLLVWAGKAVGLVMALLCLTRVIPSDGPAAWGMLAAAVTLILMGGGKRDG